MSLNQILSFINAQPSDLDDFDRQEMIDELGDYLETFTKDEVYQIVTALENKFGPVVLL
jgi:hypothetical protein